MEELNLKLFNLYTHKLNLSDEDANDLILTQKEEVREVVNKSQLNILSLFREEFQKQNARFQELFHKQELKMEKEFNKQELKMEQKFHEQDSNIKEQLHEQDSYIKEMFHEQDAKMEQRQRKQDAKIEKMGISFQKSLDKNKSDILIWLVSLIIGSIITTIGAVIAILAFFFEAAY